MKQQKLSDVEQKFILHWGQMGVQWGINRSVAQVHALLFLMEEPQTAEDICEKLGVARSNVSTSLKELQSWGIIHKVGHLGDKRDHFSSVKDVWELARIILNERKKREIDPTLRILRDCAAEAATDGDTSDHSRQRLQEMSAFLETGSAWFERMNRMPPAALKALINLGGPRPSKPGK